MLLSSSFRPPSLLFLLRFLLLLVFALQIAETRNLDDNKRAVNRSISAFFVFGDSTVDSGNNNYIETVSRSNFLPYGKDFPDHTPTGRFTNGMLVTDYLASYAGIKDYLPPYLDPTLSLEELKTGVCFASAGTGFDPITAQIDVSFSLSLSFFLSPYILCMCFILFFSVRWLNIFMGYMHGVIPIQKQLQHFKEYKSRIEGEIGKKRSRRLISKAVFLISAGTNDFMVNYYGMVTQVRRQTYNISGYQEFILELGQQLLQGLFEMGARKIAFVGLPPVGCVPAVITLNSDNALTHRGCIERLSSVARDYNRMLQSKLAAVQSQNPRATLVYVDIYNPIQEMVKNPQKHGFEKVNVGCCGSGIIEVSVLCNPYSSVCSDDSKYLFWDAIHPTQAAYYSIYQGLRPLIDRFIKN